MPKTMKQNREAMLQYTLEDLDTLCTYAADIRQHIANNRLDLAADDLEYMRGIIIPAIDSWFKSAVTGGGSGRRRSSRL